MWKVRVNEGHVERLPPDYDRCPWYLYVVHNWYSCLLQPHQGNEHKVLYGDEITTVELERQ